MTSMTVQERLAADLEAIYIGNLNTVDEDLTLPLQGEYGSAFRWESSEERFIDTEGIVHRPLHGMGNRSVRLKVIAELQGKTATREFAALVIQEERQTVVSWIRPVEIPVACGEYDHDVHLPSVVIVGCQDGRQITMPVTWDRTNIPERISDNVTVYGQLPEGTVFDTPEGLPSDLTEEMTETYLSLNRQARAEIVVCDRGNVSAAEAPMRKLKYIPMRSIRLIEGSIYYEYQQNMLEYLLAQNVDSMLYSFRRSCGLSTRGAAPMTGWDTMDCKLRGHTTGHYMSGLALAWEATGDERILRKIKALIIGLQEVQEAFADSGRVHKGFFSAYDEEQFDLLEVYTKYPEIWAPYYTLDKIMSGLYDIYQATGLQMSLQLEADLGDWVYRRLSRLPQEQLDRMWSMYIAGEFGGMIGTMVKLYELTGNEDHLKAARLFYNDKLFYPMSENCDTLEDMHANQHIPQIIGAADLYRVTGETKYWDISKNFWQMVTEHHTYVNGGVGETEMFHHPDTTGQFLSEKSEESCASYNMLRLTGELFAYTEDVSMMEYYDNTLRNHILASCCQDTSGGTTYFLPLHPGGQKEYSTTENSCCHGTGMESRFRYMEHMYAEDEDYYYVNLLIDNTVDHEDLHLSLAATFAGSGTGTNPSNVGSGTGTNPLNDVSESDAIPTKGTSETGNDLEQLMVSIRVKQRTTKGLAIRIPSWVEGKLIYEISSMPGELSECQSIGGNQTVNNKRMEDTLGWLRIPGPIPENTQIDLGLPLQLRLIQDSTDRNLLNLAYGPDLLAMISEEKELRQIPENIFRQGKCFTDGTVKMIPLNRVDQEHFHVYFRK